MACGSPVGGTNVGGIASYVESGVNGDLVEPGDIAAMTQAVSGHLAADATRRSAMRDACLQTASRYRADVVGPRLAALFTALPLG
ncbi:MAG: glycosyltransferase [Muribaculaceae bacterium]|nr:glycosyltransferase [Muribaculaceae bacterium]